MFGYIRLDSNPPKIIENNYKKHYCFLCHSLWNEYGQIARITDSFDVTFFTILLMSAHDLADVKKIKCFSQSKKLKSHLNDEISKKIASFNVLLVEGELLDKIDDKDKFYAKPAYRLFKAKFNKAHKAYPLMWEIIQDGYKKMATLEKSNASLEDIENCFGDLIYDVVTKCFDVNDEIRISYLMYVAKMIYFLDALDDLDDDIKDNHFNPLSKYESKHNIISNHFNFINDHLIELRSKIKFYNSKDLNIITVNRIILFGIPEIVTSICTRGIKK